MTRKTEALAEVDSWLRAGKSVCPYARKAVVHYAMDNEALGATLLAIQPGEAGVVIANRPLDGFLGTKWWAQDTVVTMLAAIARIARPGWSHREARTYVEQQAAILRDDDDPRRIFLAVRDKPMVPVCMAPLYPETHPRYCPRAIIVLTWLADMTAVASVRDVMKREHGYAYDALELMLPLPVVRQEHQVAGK